MLDKIKDRLNSLISSTTDEELLNKYHLIEKILAYDNCFINMDSNTAISVLCDLNFSIDEAKAIYLELLKEGYGWNIQVS